eukprot:149021_1
MNLQTMSVVIWVIIMIKQTKIVFSTGCDDSWATNAIELNNGVITACAGRDHNNIFANCNDGYHVCENARELSFLNLTRNQCANIPSKNEIFLTLEQTKGSQCESYPDDNITPTDDSKYRLWGCSSNTSDQIESNLCGGLNAAVDYPDVIDKYKILSTLCCKDAPATGCEPWRGTVHTELIPQEVYICPGGESCGDNYHICRNAKEIALFGLDSNIFPVTDAILCCRDGTGGCESKGGETELISQEVYICPGGESCGDNYHICRNAKEIALFGLDSNIFPVTDAILCCRDG